MLKNDFCGNEISRLGFGCMRLPVKPDKSIDEQEVQKMVDYAIANGVNYFDTAWPYHNGESEVVIGKALSRYPREQWYLADKYPGHQISDSYNPAEIFEEQLVKCGVSYFDYYLLHNVYENSVGVYTDKRWNIIEYFKEQKRLGRIRHLGFSSHARPDTLEKFLDYAGDCMEFCQIQLNYLDWSLQDAEAKVRLLADRKIPIIVMEPLRGGKLAALDASDEDRLRALRPNESIASWAFRWLQRLPDVRVVLSGMSDFAQMKDNVSTFTGGAPLTADEVALLEQIADKLKDAVPCTRCRYCCEGCPMGLDIPMLIHAYNDLKFAGSMTVPMQMDALPDDKRPSACIGCGACAAICPQKIDIPSVMSDLAERISKMGTWAEICRQREAAAKARKA
ncbi:MAG: aldo/keto reductase [Clostridia bacterium]|nr:aldo/keto reductase [Clostridia bacterium]